MSAIMEILNTPAKGKMPHVAVMVTVPILFCTLLLWVLDVHKNGDFPASDGVIQMPSLAFCARCAILSTPYVMYYFIWNNGMAFNSFFCNNGVEWFSTFCLSLKALQVYTFYCASFPGSSFFTLDFAALSAQLTSLPVTAWIFFITWSAAGQALNLGIYHAIGKVGVYYGFKMGHRVPWATGFPFSVVSRHPQYIGAFLSFAAFLPTLWTTAGFSNGLICMYIFLAFCYFVVSKFEESDDNPEEQKKA